MNVRELVAILSEEIDPETVVAIYDGANYRHIEKPMVEELTLSFLIGSVVTEEDIA